jgi:alkanesulfonate monooxygenase SsuD/methylene tetrahydromethanopterin reductase-like flavin-dependent oxidoreductase (luciferase family)
VARLAEELGFDAVTGNDSIAFDIKQRYHFSAGTAEAVDRVEKTQRPTKAYETMVMLSFVAGMTKKIRLIPICFVLPWRNPIMIAKQYATLQELSGGRAAFALGIGNMEADFHNFGVPFHRRGVIMDEYLLALEAIFSESPVTEFRGRFVSFSGEFLPKPENRSIFIAGGFVDASLKRVARFANGWVPVGTPEQIEVGLKRIKELQTGYNHRVPLEVGPQTWICVSKSSEEVRKKADETIRTFGGLREMVRQLKSDFTQMNLIGSVDEVSRRIEQYRAAGANFAELKFVANDLDDMKTQMGLVSAEILPSFA